MIQPAFQPGDTIDGRYAVSFVHSISLHFQNYRVQMPGGIAMLKLCTDPQTDVTDMLRVMRSAQPTHSLCGYVSDGIVSVDGKCLPYVVSEFVSHETPRQRVERKGPLTAAESLSVLTAAVRALRYLHQEQQTIHLGIHQDNILLPLTETLDCTRLVGLGNCRQTGRSEMADGSTFKQKIALRIAQADPDVCRLPPECFSGCYDERSDIYMAGSLLLYLLTASDPWALDIQMIAPQDRLRIIVAAKRKPTRLSSPLPASDGGGAVAANKNDVMDKLLDIAARCTSIQPAARPQSADVLLQELEALRQEVEKPFAQADANIRSGNGFSDVAGMNELKEKLQNDIIEVMERPDEARQLGLSIPNGILLYGPPGCGKTFLAEKLAEQMHCNYMYVHCSDVASQYIHGGQEKIAALFDEARQKAPTLLFLDELDAMVCKRDKFQNVSQSGEVNEFLVQMNNAGEHNVLVIGATNRPAEIDEAITRAGRMELRYYIGPPDHEAVVELYKIHLRKRTTEGHIDYDKLALLSEGRVSADIKLIVDTAARQAFHQHSSINQSLLIEAIRTCKPTVSREVLEQHHKIHLAYEAEDNQKQPRRPIGFA